MTKPAYTFVNTTFRNLIVLPLLVASAALCCVMAVAGYLYFSLVVVGQTTEVARLSTNIAVHVYHLDNIERDYLINSTSPALADTVEVERTASKLRVLRELLGDDAQQVARADDVINGWMRWRSEMDPLLEQRRNGFDVVPTLQRGGGAPSVTGMAAELGSIANRAREQRAANYSRMGITIASLLGSLTLGFAALAVIFALRGHKQISYLASAQAQAGQSGAAQADALHLQDQIADAQSRISHLFSEAHDFAAVAQPLLALVGQWTGALAGALYVATEHARYRRVAIFGTQPGHVPASSYATGYAARSAARPGWLSDDMHEYVPLAAQLGENTPASIVALPLRGTSGPTGVLELAFIDPPDAAAAAMLDQIQYSVGHAIESCLLRERGSEPPGLALQ
ncbi:hypothetical protein JCM19000A_31660 [Silvimonas sp. JCM 19000]